MADISKIKLPSGSEYDLKDSWARQQIEAITGGNAIVFRGVSSTALTDGGTEVPTVGGSQVTDVEVGNMFFYNDSEFIWYEASGGTECWAELGPVPSELGELAYADTATGSTTYTPGGSVSGSFSGTGVRLVTDTDVPTSASFSGSSMTSTGNFTPQGSVAVSSAGATGAAATAVTVGDPSSTAITNAITYWSVSGEVLSLKQIGYSTSNFKTGDASYSFSGSEGSVSVSGTPSGSVSLSGSASTVSPASSGTATYTPAGSVSGSFSGTEATISITATPDTET